MELRTIGVVGAEQMGAGIAQCCVQAGLEVVLVDDTEEILSAAEDRILRGLQRAEQPAAFSLMRKATRLDRLESCDLVVECGSEAPEAKQDLLRRIDARVRPSSILAVETSALPVHIAARAVENPERVVGMRFFHPPSIAKLIEVIRYEHASDGALDAAFGLARTLGKTPVRCKDSPGFIVNRILRPYYLTAMRLLEQGRGTPLSIDAALREKGGFPAGPFQLVDFFGLVEDFAVSEIVFQLLDQPQRLKPPRVEELLILKEAKGRSCGRGFYLYEDALPGTVNPALRDLLKGYCSDPMEPGAMVDAVLEAVFIEARQVVESGVASRTDVDTAMCLGAHWPKGPFEWEEERK